MRARVRRGTRDALHDNAGRDIPLGCAQCGIAGAVEWEKSGLAFPLASDTSSRVESLRTGRPPLAGAGQPGINAVSVNFSTDESRLEFIVR